MNQKSKYIFIAIGSFVLGILFSDMYFGANYREKLKTYESLFPVLDDKNITVKSNYDYLIEN